MTAKARWTRGDFHEDGWSAHLKLSCVFFPSFPLASAILTAKSPARKGQTQETAHSRRRKKENCPHACPRSLTCPFLKLCKRPDFSHTLVSLPTVLFPPRPRLLELRWSKRVVPNSFMMITLMYEFTLDIYIRDAFVPC